MMYRHHRKLNWKFKHDLLRNHHKLSDLEFEGESELQIVPNKTGKYGITIDLNKDAFSEDPRAYKLSLYVGDELYRESIIWDNITGINCIEEEDEAEVDYEPVNDEVPPWEPKTNIEHIFGEPEPEPLAIFPMIFSCIVAFPLIYFIYYIYINGYID